MPDCRVGHQAETLKFERFQEELPPPYGPFSYRFCYGVKAAIDGKQWGLKVNSSNAPGELEWKDMEDTIAKQVAFCRANPII